MFSPKHFVGFLTQWLILYSFRDTAHYSWAGILPVPGTLLESVNELLNVRKEILSDIGVKCAIKVL